MLKAEQIDRSMEHAEQLPVAAPQQDRLLSQPEARSQPGEARSNTPAVPTRRPGAIKPTADRDPRTARKQRVRWGLFALLPLVLIGGAYWYVTGGQRMSTDDAYVEADTVGISTDVSGIVKDVDVIDNQHVDADQVLYRLDPLQFQIALDNATAKLAQTGLTIDAMKQDYSRMLSDVAAQQGQVDLDQVNDNRFAVLVKSDTVSQASYDNARYTLEVDENKLKSLRQQAAVQLAKLDGNPNIPVTQHPQYLEAKANVDEAQRELDHTVVRAPFAGTVTNVPAIEPGKYLAASTAAFYLVDRDHVWVEATPKETQLTYVRPGQPVSITVDTYPNVQWHGTVESISPAGAQQFQLLPAQNTSGNWVKVVQRINLRVRVDTSDQRLPPLSAGMSVEVNVDTGHARGVPHFLTALFDHSHGSVS